MDSGLENKNDKKEAVPDLENQSLNLDTVGSVPIKIQAVLGKTKVTIGQLIKFKRGAVIELDSKVGDPIKIVANDIPIATGEITILENSIGITLTEISRGNTEE